MNSIDIYNAHLKMKNASRDFNGNVSYKRNGGNCVGSICPFTDLKKWIFLTSVFRTFKRWSASDSFKISKQTAGKFLQSFQNHSTSILR